MVENAKLQDQIYKVNKDSLKFADVSARIMAVNVDLREEIEQLKILNQSNKDEN